MIWSTVVSVATTSPFDAPGVQAACRFSNTPAVLTHRFLLREVWGPQDSPETHYLRVFVASLGRKLEADPAQPRYILTEPGVGYPFSVA